MRDPVRCGRGRSADFGRAKFFSRCSKVNPRRVIAKKLILGANLNLPPRIPPSLVHRHFVTRRQLVPVANPVATAVPRRKKLFVGEFRFRPGGFGRPCYSIGEK